MPNNSNVCSVVVIYNGDGNLNSNILSLLAQTAKVVAIDNASTSDISAYIKDFLSNEHFILIQNDKNEGIAYALNQGLEYATRNNFDYLLTMDQDSILPLDSVERMLALMEAGDIDSIGSNYANLNNENELIEKNFLITSGNLTKVTAANEVGGYENKMFIDGVDIDFSLKLRLANKKIAIARDVKMEHKLGTYYTGKCLGFKKNISIHSPLRIYYIFRNNKFLMQKYHKLFRLYCVKLKIGAFLIKLEIMFYYPKTTKKECLLAIKRGVKDGKIL